MVLKKKSRDVLQLLRLFDNTRSLCMLAISRAQLSPYERNAKHYHTESDAEGKINIAQEVSV
jgi:hypothetical protein